jgi:hypothetical protein
VGRDYLVDLVGGPMISLTSRVWYQRVECYAPEHCHRAPVQHVFLMLINCHWVELTIDGHLCNVCIDGNVRKTKIDVSAQSAAAFIREQTS